MKIAFTYSKGRPEGWATRAFEGKAVGGSLAGVESRDAGRKQLKGIKGRQRVFEVVW